MIRVLAILFLPLAAYAHGPVWFQLCKHESGEPVTEYKFHGMDTDARQLIDVDQIGALSQLRHNKCTLLIFRDGSRGVVKGSVQEVACRIGWKPCKDE